jgi:hypothetical protein
MGEAVMTTVTLSTVVPSVSSRPRGFKVRFVPWVTMQRGLLARPLFRMARRRVWMRMAVVMRILMVSMVPVLLVAISMAILLLTRPVTLRVRDRFLKCAVSIETVVSNVGPRPWLLTLCSDEDLQRLQLLEEPEASPEREAEKTKKQTKKQAKKQATKRKQPKAKHTPGANKKSAECTTTWSRGSWARGGGRDGRGRGGARTGQGSRKSKRAMGDDSNTDWDPDKHA